MILMIFKQEWTILTKSGYFYVMIDVLSIDWGFILNYVIQM